MHKAFALTVLLLPAFLSFAQHAKPYNVRVSTLSEADALHPTNYYSADAGYILDLMFQTLITVDPYTEQQVPVLAKALPEINYDRKKDITTLTYELRPEAKWGNGSAITANDVAFSLKFSKCPAINNDALRPYLKDIADVVLYADDTLKITVVVKGKHILNEYTVGETFILPEYVYDEGQVLRNYTLEKLNKLDETRQLPKDLTEYGRKYNSEPYSRDPNYIVGSGAYKLNAWVTGQKIELLRKRGWWADKLSKDQKSIAFDAYPDTITFVNIVDEAASVAAFKSGYVDVLTSIRSKTFIDMQSDEQLKRKANFYSTNTNSYSYLGLNMNSRILQDIKVRQALAHLADVDRAIRELSLGFAVKTIGPLSLHKKSEYNDTITPYAFDLKAAGKLLDEAGWKDSNCNGIRDKVIDGNLVEMSLNFTVNAGNDIRYKFAEMMQESAAKVGIEITIRPVEWSIFLEKNKTHDFDIMYGAWITSHTPSSPRQIWHTSSYMNGSNYVGFGDAETDKLIEDIEQEMDIEKRKHLYDKLQVIIHQQVPYVFLTTPQEKLMMSKKFEPITPFVDRPNYKVGSIRIKQ